LSKLIKLAYPAENDEFIYVPKRVIDFISKSAIITDQHVEGRAGGKLILKYESKTGSSNGTMEINDMGPDTIKNKKSKEEN